MAYTRALSYSSIKLFKKCPRAWESNYILKEPRPKNKAAERGTKLHDLLEKFFLKLTPFPHEDSTLKRWRRFMEHLTTFDPHPEAELAVNSTWEPVLFNAETAYYRGKADLCYEENGGETLVICDWKSGKIYPDHKDQGETYVALHTEKEYANYRARFVYLDLPLEVRNYEYTAEHRRKHIEALRWDIEEVRTAENFDPTPSTEACRWCHLSWREGGKCNVAS